MIETMTGACEDGVVEEVGTSATEWPGTHTYTHTHIDTLAH